MTVIQNNLIMIGPMIRNSKHLLKYRAQIHIICVWHKMSLSGVHHKEGERKDDKKNLQRTSSKVPNLAKYSLTSSSVTV